jgi:hypothetical protein
MTGVRSITVLWGPLDGEYIPASAILVTAHYAMFVIRKSNALWLEPVLPIPGIPNTYITDASASPVMLSENVPPDVDDADIIAKTYRMLTDMTGFDFVTRVLMDNGLDVELFPHD